MLWHLLMVSAGRKHGSSLSVCMLVCRPAYGDEQKVEEIAFLQPLCHRVKKKLLTSLWKHVSSSLGKLCVWVYYC